MNRFVITGKMINITDEQIYILKNHIDINQYSFLYVYPKRKGIRAFIEKHDGIFAGSVSGNTDYLICNDTKTETTKIIEARNRGIPIISEKRVL